MIILSERDVKLPSLISYWYESIIDENIKSEMAIEKKTTDLIPNNIYWNFCTY